MRCFKLAIPAAAICGLFSSAQAQTSDWKSVEKLAPGTTVSVLERARGACEIVQVTDSELICHRGLAGHSGTYVIRRAKVREVRLEHPDRNHMFTGALIGGITGGVLGFVAGDTASDPEIRGYARFYGILAGACIGGVIGHAIHKHGPVVYLQRSAVAPGEQSSYSCRKATSGSACVARRAGT
ncbi:MAG: hypothetical protein JO061_03285 [Acidobacteriaceae bacterium]|nr:hypothetical protein [Acidobacteriaceae bacterium]